jgi:tetratricopeptide (TPR) repeat protein
MKNFIYIKYIILFLLMQDCRNISAQNLDAIDSLQNLIKLTSNDTVKHSALLDIAGRYKNYDLKKALNYLEQALSLSIKLKIPKKIGFTHNQLGDLYLSRNDFGSASSHFLTALKIYENLKDSSGIARNYYNLGKIYYSQKNYEGALNYFNKSLCISLESNKKKEISANYNFIGIIYTLTGKYKEAIDSYHKLLIISKEIGNKQGEASSYANMSMVYFYMGKLNLAIENTEKAIKIHEKEGDKENLLSTYSNLGALSIQAKKYDKAAIALQKAMKYIGGTNDKELIRSVYDNFSDLYEKQNDFHKAFEYVELNSAMKDTIYSESNNRQANELTSQYESETKELAIINLEKDKALSEEKLASEKNFKIYLLIFSLFIASFAFVLYRGNVQKRKANIALSFAYEEIESKNKDISDSINYSKRIQDASLAPKELKYKLFPDAFVLFKPKDIVSGDFYWYAEKDGKRLIASCDCTGHGVPGALMSMIGNNILNQIVNEKGITSPDEILNRLHKEVRKALKQEELGASKDGMDIALICFNSETEIEYAGAHRPLWIINKIDNGELIIDNETSLQLQTKKHQLVEIKPDKFSIGGHQSETERKFTNHKILLSKGDCIYIFSDGFVDQFGGNEGRKFMSKRFKDLLLADYSTPMLEQENKLINTFETWKGSREQVDDLLVIGIRI